jgi:hypothetical protein
VHPQAARDWVARIPPGACRFIEASLADEMNAFGYHPASATASPALGRS